MYHTVVDFGIQVHLKEGEDLVVVYKKTQVDA